MTGAIVSAVLSKIYQTKQLKVVLNTLGGGAKGIQWMLNTPHAESTILHCNAPTSNTMASILFEKSSIQCNKQSSHLLADHAYRQALSLTTENGLVPSTTVIGLGCTAQLRTHESQRTKHRAHFSLKQSDNRFHHYELLLDKTADRPRHVEDEVVSLCLMHLLVDYCCEMNLLFEDDEHVLALRQAFQSHCLSSDKFITFSPTSLTQLSTSGEAPVLPILPNHPVVLYHNSLFHQMMDIKPYSHTLVLPGSFNPLHQGHRGLLQAATLAYAKHRGCPSTQVRCVFEITTRNVDKPAIHDKELSRRLSQFDASDHVLLTNLPRFIDKVRHSLPRISGFVIGYDTAIRLISPRYYNDSVDDMMDALFVFLKNNVCFYVGGRVDDQGHFKTLDDLQLPPGLRPLFISIPDFRLDLSSTQLRQEQLQQNH